RWMSNDKRIQKLIWDQLERAVSRKTRVQVINLEINDTARLLACRELIDVGDYRQFPNGTWPEYFAVLALIHIGLACDDEHDRRRRKASFREEQWENTTQEAIAYWVFDAIEAITTAEWIQREDLLRVTQSLYIQAETTKHISLKAQSAAIARHAKTDTLKEEFIAYRLAHPKNSTAAVARQFLDSLDADRRRILAPTNAVRTLTSAWTAHRKKLDRDIPQKTHPINLNKNRK
ncbi:hypothetical protein, partial [Acidiferrobacter sp.]|uniref:hypothetical protein n=1 Tax=Acidiferrobacter sp. TaxID=1872107 RepID=UPI0026331B2E